jgi:hypothetical protein
MTLERPNLCPFFERNDEKLEDGLMNYWVVDYWKIGAV